MKLLVDGVPGETAYIQTAFNERGIFSGWHPLSAVIPAGGHQLRVEYFLNATWDSGSYLYNPAVQVDDAKVIAPLDVSFIEALGAPSSEIWLAGGEGVFSLAAAAGRSGGNALRAKVPPFDSHYYYPNLPWLMHEVTGPATVSRWTRSLADQAAVVPLGEWKQEYRIIPPGPQQFFWKSAGNELIDGTLTQPAPEIPLAEALEAEAAGFTQSSAGAWRGVLTAAAPDGVDSAWTVIDPGGETWLETDVSGPSGVSFLYSNRASSAAGFGLSFALGGKPAAIKEGRYAAVLPAGIHRLRWSAKNPGTVVQPAVVLLDQLLTTPLAPVSLADALDGGGLEWTTGNPPWSGLAGTAAPDGLDAAVPPFLEEGGSSWVETTVSGPGRLTFYWPLSNMAPGYIYKGSLTLFVDGKEITQQHSGQSRPVVEVGPGGHTFRWSAAPGKDFWNPPVLDQVVWDPSPALSLLPILGGDSGIFFADDSGLASVAAGSGPQGGAALRLKLKWPVNYGSPDRDVSMWFPGAGRVSYWTRRRSTAYLTTIDPSGNTGGRDEAWRSYSVWLGPGQYRMTWTLNGDYSTYSPEAEVLLGEVSFSPASTIPLAFALNEGSYSTRPWRTSPTLPWVGLSWNAEQGIGAYAPPASVAEPSWLETDVTGPAVVSYRSTGDFVRIALGESLFPNTYSSQSKAVYIPPGRHILRWLNQGVEATLGKVIHRPMPGVVKLEMILGEPQMTVPRPNGIADSGITVQVLENGEWKPDSGAVMIGNSVSQVRYRLPADAMGSSRIYRVSFAAP